MSFKVTRSDEGVVYNPPGHFDVRPTRLHNPEDVLGGSLTMGLSHFLPGGGTEYGANDFECIYYVVEGQMQLEVERGTDRELLVTLQKGDSFHCSAGIKKSIRNSGCEASQLLVTLLKSTQKATAE